MGKKEKSRKLHIHRSYCTYTAQIVYDWISVILYLFDFLKLFSRSFAYFVFFFASLVLMHVFLCNCRRCCKHTCDRNKAKIADGTETEKKGERITNKDAIDVQKESERERESSVLVCCCFFFLKSFSIPDISNSILSYSHRPTNERKG